MPVQAEKQKKIIDILGSLPAERVDEIIDFAEYLKKKSQPPQEAKMKARPLKIPAFHLGHIEKQAFDREKLYGDYLDRKFECSNCTHFLLLLPAHRGQSNSFDTSCFFLKRLSIFPNPPFTKQKRARKCTPFSS